MQPNTDGLTNNVANRVAEDTLIVCVGLVAIIEHVFSA